MSLEVEREPRYIGRSLIAIALSVAILIVLTVVGTWIAAVIGRELFFVQVIIPGGAAFLAPTFATSIVRQKYDPAILGWGYFTIAVLLAIIYAILVFSAPAAASISNSDKFIGALQVAAIAGGAWLSYRQLR